MAALVSIVMGSESDAEAMAGADERLSDFGISHEVRVISAHRSPNALAEYAKAAAENGIKVIIAGAGGAAALPGCIAAHTHLPVIGVPLDATPLSGVDSLYSMVQMPRGVPVAAVAIGGAENAAILAAQILAVADADIAKKVQEFKSKIGRGHK